MGSMPEGEYERWKERNKKGKKGVKERKRRKRRRNVMVSLIKFQTINAII
jgi:hypothetical protein